MKLSTLINHSSELLRIIRKSPQAADKLASQYFRLKKYIGSKDRKFISECVFSSLRILLLAEYCSKKASTANNYKVHSKNTKINSNVPLKNAHNYDILEEIGIIIANCVITHKYNCIFPKSTRLLTPIEVLPKILIDENFDLLKELAVALDEISEIDLDSAKKWISSLLDSYVEINSAAIEIIKSGDGLDENALDIISIRFSLPVWILKHLIENGFSVQQVSRLGESLLIGAKVCLRVNDRLLSREIVKKELELSGINCKFSGLSPSGIVLNKRVKLDNHPLYRSGVIEVQDEGSQLIGFALAPQEGDSVLDACAGAGGKTLHIASLLNDSGQILATDIEINRLKEISKRAKRSGFKSISVKLLKRNNNQINGLFDAVLVDAPCSGMGTTRRMPMAKWRLNEKLLAKHNKNQLKILTHYSQYVKPGGILLYATCSIMPAENDLLVDDFLQQNPDFKPDSLYLAFDLYDIKIEGLGKEDFKLNLLPSLHGSDGFFMARMRRVNEDEEL